MQKSVDFLFSVLFEYSHGMVMNFTLKLYFDNCCFKSCCFLASGNPNMVMALAGNKSDLLDGRKVAAEVSIYPFL